MEVKKNQVKRFPGIGRYILVWDKHKTKELIGKVVHWNGSLILLCVNGYEFAVHSDCNWEYLSEVERIESLKSKGKQNFHYTFYDFLKNSQKETPKKQPKKKGRKGSFRPSVLPLIGDHIVLYSRKNNQYKKPVCVGRLNSIRRYSTLKNPIVDIYVERTHSFSIHDLDDYYWRHAVKDIKTKRYPLPKMCSIVNINGLEGQVIHFYNETSSSAFKIKCKSGDQFRVSRYSEWKYV